MPLSQVGRILALVCISLTLYGGGCVFIVLISQLLGSLVANAGTIKQRLLFSEKYILGLQLHLCQWMVIVALMLIPLTWAGTPKDFWPIAVGALITTVVACLLIIVACVLKGTELETVEFPAPTFEGSFKGEDS